MPTIIKIFFLLFFQHTLTQGGGSSLASATAAVQTPARLYHELVFTVQGEEAVVISCSNIAEGYLGVIASQAEGEPGLQRVTVQFNGLSDHGLNQLIDRLRKYTLLIKVEILS